MQPFEFGQISKLGSANKQTRYVVGGTTLVDLMRLGVERPQTILDLRPLSDTQPQMMQITEQEGAVHIGALVSMTQTAEHALIQSRYPALSEALLLSASQQIRNMASMGGNVMQRTRCGYFRNTDFAACNKRDADSGCAALSGNNRQHAILGGSPSCVAVHPSDACVALAAYGASLHLISLSGERELLLSDFLLKPNDTPQAEHDLRAGEVISHIILPPHKLTSVYLKIRDRQSYQFAVVSVAAGLQLEGGRIKAARLSLGGVGTVPWRSDEAEAALMGEVASSQVFERAAEQALRQAQPLSHNTFKVELAKRAVVRAFETVLQQTQQGGGA